MKSSPPPAYQDRQAAIDLAKVGSSARKSLFIEGLKPLTSFRVERLAPGGRGDPVAVWRHMGAPDTLSREATRELVGFSEYLDTSFIKADEEGKLVFEEHMAPWTLIALTQLPASSKA